MSDTICLEDMIIDASYSGPRMEADADGTLVVTLPFVTELIAAFKAQGKLHRRYAFEILLAVRAPSPCCHSSLLLEPATCAYWSSGLQTLGTSTLGTLVFKTLTLGTVTVVCKSSAQSRCSVHACLVHWGKHGLASL